MNFFEGTKKVGKSIRKYLCCFLCTGPILLIVGISMLSMISHTRERAVDSYNAAVEKWTSDIRSQFQNLTIDSGPVQLIPTISISDVSFDTSGDLKTYEPLMYRGAVSVGEVGGENWWIEIGNAPNNSTYPLAGIKQRRTYTTTYDCNRKCRREDGKQVCTTLTPCSDICGVHGGSTVTMGSTSASCLFSVYLERVCIAVRKDTSTSWGWVPSTLNIDSSGCYYVGETQGLGQFGSNYPATYKSSNSSTIILEIRHEQDPYVVAAQLTAGSYSFGLRFLQKVAIGLTFLIVGATWTLAVICLFKKIVQCIEARLPEEHKTHPDNPPILPPISSAPYDVNPGSLPFTNSPQPYPYPIPPPPSIPPQYAYPYTPPAPDHVPPFGPPSTDFPIPHGAQVPPDHWHNNPSGYQPPPYAAPVPMLQQQTPYAGAASFQQPMPYGATAPVQQSTQYPYSPLLQPQPGFGRQ